MPRDIENSEKRSSRREKESEHHKNDRKKYDKKQDVNISSKIENQNDVTTLATTTNTIEYRGKDKLENYLAGYENKISDIQNLVSKNCESEMKAFEEAREKLEKKLKQVMNSPKMQKMEDEVNEAANDVSLQMRHMQREIEAMQDKIQEDTRLSKEERQAQQFQLSSMAIDEIKRLHEKYPSAMKAQMMSQMLLIR